MKRYLFNNLIKDHFMHFTYIILMLIKTYIRFSMYVLKEREVNLEIIFE